MEGKCIVRGRPAGQITARAITPRGRRVALFPPDSLKESNPMRRREALLAGVATAGQITDEMPVKHGEPC